MPKIREVKSQGNNKIPGICILAGETGDGVFESAPRALAEMSHPVE
jgi:hypothetical protein